MTPEKTVRGRDALATIVEYVLLIFVSSIVVAGVLQTMDQGVIHLVKRVGQLLALGR